MADIRIKDLATTAASTASDDFIAVDGSANGTRKLNAYSPTFGGNLTVSGTGNITGATTFGANVYVPNANYYRSKNAANTTDYRLIGLTSGDVVSIDADARGATVGGNLTVSGTGQSSLSSSSALFAVGTSSPTSTNSVGVPQITAESDLYSSVASIAHNTTDGNYGFFLTGKSRGTKASPLIVANGDRVGGYGFMAYDGAAYRTSAEIVGVIDGTPGAADLPTRLSFRVAADGSASPSEQMRLTSSGNLLLKSDGVDGGQKLQVAGSAILSTAEPILSLSSTAASSIAYQLISGGGSGHTTGTFKIYDSSLGYTVLSHAKGTSGPSTRLSFDAAGVATFASTAASTSTTTGALVVSGGVGVAGDVYAGGTTGFKLGSSSGAYRFSSSAYIDSESSSIIRLLDSGGNFATAKVGVGLVLSSTASTTTGTGALQVSGGVGIAGAANVGTYYGMVDGVTAPSATAGYAKIYVDTADGDLKVIFGDGTVKTIATDS